MAAITPFIRRWQKQLLVLGLCLLNGSGLLPATAQDSEQLRKTFQQTIEIYPQQLIEARQAGNRLLEAQTMSNAGLAYQFLGEYQKAVDLYLEALAIAKTLSEPAFTDTIVQRLTAAYSQQGDNRGINFLTEQLKQAKASGDRTYTGILLKNLGLAYLSIFEYPRVIEIYEEYLPLIRASKDRSEEANALNILSRAYGLTKQPEKQITLLEQQLAIAQEIGNVSLQLSALSSLIYAYPEVERVQDAIAAAEQAVQIAQKAQDPTGEIFALQQLGLLHGRLGNSQKLISALEAALALSQKINNPFLQAFTLQYLSITYGLLGNYAKGIELQSQGLEIYQKLRQQGIASLESMESVALSNLGYQQYKMGQFSAAETTIKKALAAYNQAGKLVLGNTNLFAYTRDELNISLRDAIADLYRNLQQILVATNRLDEALEVAESGKARAFIDLLTTNLGVPPQSLKTTPDLTVAQMRQIAKAQNSTLVQYSVVYNKNIFSMVQLGKQELYETTLYIWVIKPSGEVIFRKGDLEPVWSQFQPTQSKYFRLTSFVIDARNSIFLRGRSSTASENPAGSDRATSAREVSQQLQQLHHILIDPIADLLPTDPQQRITFIPQNALFLVPFPALQDANGKYLIEKHTLLTAPSIQALELTHQQRQQLKTSASTTALVVGNPTMPSLSTQPGEAPTQLPSLPGAEVEANAIASLLKTQPLIGAQATETAVIQQMPKARFIHLATHGLLDSLAGFQSSLAFAPDPPTNQANTIRKDGFLTAREIINLPLKAELVVLSACDTGRGRISGDGVIGLSRSFMAAGAVSVIVSLWKVPDKPTADLMLTFYQTYQKVPDKAQALRQAMLTTLAKYPTPRDWAAFTLIGEAD